MGISFEKPRDAGKREGEAITPTRNEHILELPQTERNERDRFDLTRVVVRPYREEDGDIVRAMHRQGLEQSGVYPGPNYVYKDMQDIKTSYIDAAGSTFLVAEYDGRVIGMGACKPAQNPERAEIVRISVDSEHQGLGVGTRIQLELLKEAQIMGYRYADLTTSVEQISAQVIYTKLGFKVPGLEILHKGDLTIPIIHFTGKIPDIIGYAAARLQQWQHNQYFRTPGALF